MNELLKHEVKEWIKSIVIALIIAVFIREFIFNTTFVSGVSMNPTLNHRDRLISTKLPLYNENIKRGDIVNFNAPDADEIYIKRVIGLPGDRIEIKQGQVYLNGEELIEEYIEKDAYTDISGKNNWEIEEGQVFVLGDNRQPYKSNDSRSFGPIDMDTIIGVSNFRYYPFNSKFGKIQLK